MQIYHTIVQIIGHTVQELKTPGILGRTTLALTEKVCRFFTKGAPAEERATLWNSLYDHRNESGMQSAPKGRLLFVNALLNLMASQKVSVNVVQSAIKDFAKAKAAVACAAAEKIFQAQCQKFTGNSAFKHS